MIRQASERDAETAAGLALRLWPGHTRQQLAEELLPYCTDSDKALFLCEEAGAAVGFAQCGLRRDYVEGCAGGPVGYLEGIYVVPACRGAGRARALAEACQAWARGKGCAEFASDCELDNTASQAMHRALGFSEAGRIVCYVKRL